MSAELVVTVTEAMIDAFAALSGDTNPLHTDAAYARSRGFAGRVAHGQLTAAFLSTLVGVHLPGRRALLQGVRTTFHAPVLVGDVLTVRGSIDQISEAVRRVELRAEVRNQAGKAVLKAHVSVGVLP